MDKIIKNWNWILFLLMATSIVVLYEYASLQKKKYSEEIKFQQTRAIRDSIDYRRLIRLKEDEAFKFRDSLRQQKIEYITLQNEKTRKQIKDVIRILPTSDTQYRDSLWTSEWTKQDSATYR